MKPICLLLGSLLLSVPAFSQAVNIDIQNLIEYRSSLPYYSHLLIKGAISGIKPQEGRMIRLSDTYAIDELGDTLQLTRNEWRSFSYFPDCQLALDLPPRKSRSIPQLRGKVQLLTPSEENGSIVHLQGFSSQKGINLLGSREDSLQLMVLDSINFSAFATSFQQLLPKHLRQQDPNLSEAALEVNLDVMDRIIATGNQIAQTEHKLYLAIEDPKSSIIRMIIQDQNGTSRDLIAADFRIPMDEQLAVPLGLKEQQFRHLRLACFQLETAPETDWEIKLTIASGPALEEYSFTIQNITLP